MTAPPAKAGSAGGDIDAGSDGRDIDASFAGHDGDPGSAGGSPLACRACGTVYDPRAGDAARAVPPGTPFDRLPESWRCPGCGGPQHGFRAPDRAGGDPMTDRVAALVAAYRRIAERDMADVPICNPALAVEAVGFRPFGPGWIGCVIAPWFLNAVLVPRDPAWWADRRDGDKAEVALPSGAYRFTAARLGALGTLGVIPLVSAMNVFTGPDDARAAAALALDRLMQPVPEAPPDDDAAEAAPRPALSRRALFGARRR